MSEPIPLKTDAERVAWNAGYTAAKHAYSECNNAVRDSMRDQIRALLEHNQALRSQLRAGRWYQLGLSLALVALAFIRACR